MHKDKIKEIKDQNLAIWKYSTP